MSAQVTARGAATAPETEGGGLLPPAEEVAILRGALGDAIPEQRPAAAAAALDRAEAARWETLPPTVNPDVGFNCGFLVCAETCWLGRQILIEGPHFRIFRQRD
jgi:hypothetical protein